MTFGLDIGSHSIKAVELEPLGKNGWRLVAAGITPTPGPGILSGSEKAPLEVAEALKKLVSDAKITIKNVVLALPEQQVYTRLVSFPPLTDTEINSAIEWQLESYIPVPKKDSVYDHQIVTRTEREVEVLLIACPRTIVDRYMKVVQLAGLYPQDIETELIALSRSIAPIDKRSLVIDFGAISTDVAVVISGQFMLSRSIPTAGEALTRAVSQGIGVAVVQAEEYKRTYGLREKELEGKVRAATLPVVRFVTDEIKKVVGYWSAQHQDQAIETVVISGGTAGLPELVTLLAADLGIEVKIGDPFARVQRDEQTARALSPYAPLYSVAIGLAMKETKG